MRKTLVALLVALATVLAGCSDSGGGKNGGTNSEPDRFDDVTVTDTTGAIRGLVFNEAIVPIADVLVTLSGGKNVTTDKDGAFVFSDLEPGTYFLSASKFGFKAVQASTEVVAGQKDPPVTKIQLVALANQQPFVTQQVWEGFLQCGFVVANGAFGFQACGTFDDRFIHYFTLDDGIPTYAQAEMVWSSTQALAADLDLSYYDGGTWHFKNISGNTPLILNATGDDIADWWTENATELPMRVFPGSASPASVVLNQQFTVYMTFFYNFSPRQGWAFVNDGPCANPSQCS